MATTNDNWEQVIKDAFADMDAKEKALEDARDVRDIMMRLALEAGVRQTQIAEWTGRGTQRISQLAKRAKVGS